MTKEDYMKLSKERLAELLANRDSLIDKLFMIDNNTPYAIPPCYSGGPCTNPHYDCINCPRKFNSGGITSPNSY